MSSAAERDRGIAQIATYFRERDNALRAISGTTVRDTPHGIWGATDVGPVAALCARLGLEEGMRFCDLGSGDGRVALIAALWCDSVGIEGDATLHTEAQQAKDTLIGHVPSLARCELTLGDYTAIDLSGFDVIFAFADHAWPEAVEKALLARERPGIVVSHQDIFRPSILRKGPTIWIGQDPFVTYPIGKQDDAQR